MIFRQFPRSRNPIQSKPKPGTHVKVEGASFFSGAHLLPRVALYPNKKKTMFRTMNVQPDKKKKKNPWPRKVKNGQKKTRKRKTLNT